MLQKRISGLSPYFRGMEITNGTLIVKVLYEDKWGAYPSEDERVKIAKSEEMPNEWFYYADYEVVPMDEVFNLIEETIHMNKSAEKKLELLSQRFEELKTLFATESLERLETLHFVLDAEPKTKTKRKSSPKKKKVNKESEKIEMENQITVEENNEELIVVG